MWLTSFLQTDWAIFSPPSHQSPELIPPSRTLANEAAMQMLNKTICCKEIPPSGTDACFLGLGSLHQAQTHSSALTNPLFNSTHWLHIPSPSPFPHHPHYHSLFKSTTIHVQTRTKFLHMHMAFHAPSLCMHSHLSTNTCTYTHSTPTEQTIGLLKPLAYN